MCSAYPISSIVVKIEMADNSSNVGIKKFDKDNFQPWKFHMRNYLIGKDLWGYVTGEYKELTLSKRDVTVE